MKSGGRVGSSATRVSYQSRIKTDSENPSSNIRTAHSVCGSRWTTGCLMSSPVNRAPKCSSGIEPEFLTVWRFLDLSSRSRSSSFESVRGESPKCSIHSHGRFCTGSPFTRVPLDSRCEWTRLDTMESKGTFARSVTSCLRYSVGRSGGSFSGGASG